MKLFLLGLLIWAPHLISAPSHYVTDVLYIPLRATSDPSSASLKLLKSGDALIQLDNDLKSGYMLVKTIDNIEGYIPQRYLVDEPIAAVKLALLSEKGKNNKEAIDLNKIELESVKAENKKLAAELLTLNKAHTDTTKSYEELKAASGNAAELSAESKNLKAQLEKSEAELLDLRAKADLLGANNQNEGFKLGITAILFGIFLGFVFPYLKPRGRAKRMGSVKLR